MPLQDLAAESLIRGEAEFHQRPMLEINLVLDVKEPLARPLVKGGRRRIQHAQPRARGVGVIQQKARVQDIRRGEIHLPAQQVAQVPACRSVLALRQLLDDVFDKLHVGAVGKPGSAFPDRARQVESRCPVLQYESLVAGNTGNEIGSRIAELVVAGFRLDG